MSSGAILYFVIGFIYTFVVTERDEEERRKNGAQPIDKLEKLVTYGLVGPLIWPLHLILRIIGKDK